MSTTTLVDFVLEEKQDLSDPTGYYDRKEWSNSKLSDYIRQKKGGFRVKIGEKAATMGKLLHTITFEPHLEEQETEVALIVLTKKEVNLVRAMARTIRQHRTLVEFLSYGQTEFEKEYFFELHGLPFKMKSDAVASPFMGDAKSTACKTYDEFVQSCVDYGYFRQAHIYMHGSGCKHFYIWGVTKKEPCQVFFVNVANEPFRMAEAAQEVEFYCNMIKEEEAAGTSDAVQFSDFSFDGQEV